MTIQPRKTQDLTEAMALVEASIPPHFKFPPIWILNMGIPTGINWHELKAVSFIIKSCIFVLKAAYLAEKKLQNLIKPICLFFFLLF